MHLTHTTWLHLALAVLAAVAGGSHGLLTALAVVAVLALREMVLREVALREMALGELALRESPSARPRHGNTNQR